MEVITTGENWVFREGAERKRREVIAKTNDGVSKVKEDRDAKQAIQYKSLKAKQTLKE